MKLFVAISALLCVAAAQQGYSRGGPQQGYSSGGPGGFNPGNGLSDQGFQGYPDRAGEGDGEGEEVGSIPGRPGEDYPIYDTVPETSFKCDDQEFPGYYADPEAQCQAFHICHSEGKQDSFLCPNGTLFNQKYLVCDWYFNVDCSQAESLWRETNEAVVNAMKEADERIARERAAQQGGYDRNAQSISNDQGYQYRPNGNGNGNRGQSNGNRNSATPRTPSDTYGAPQQGNGLTAPSANGFGAPSSTYGAPNGNGQRNGQRNGNATPSRNYGAPAANGRGNGNGRGTSTTRTGPGFASASASFSNGARNGATPSQQYGVPSRNSGNGYSNGNGRNGNSRNGAATPSQQYGAPSRNNGNGYSNGNSRNTAAPSTQYGAPNAQNDFGSSPSTEYGPPDRAAHSLGAPLTQYDPSTSGDSFSNDFSTPSSQYGVPDRSYLPPSK